MTADIQSDDSKKDFALSSSRSILFGVLLLVYGIWILLGSGLIDNTDDFGFLSLFCGIFMIIGGFSFFFEAPRSIAATGSLIALTGSAFATYMFLTLANLRLEMVKFYPLEVSLPAALFGILSFIASFSQLCKSI